MQLLSKEAEINLLNMLNDHLEKRYELDRKKDDTFDLIARHDVIKKLEVTGTTLNNWEKLGLRVYQSPFENSKKIYYRKSDIYNFLSVN